MGSLSTVTENFDRLERGGGGPGLQRPCVPAALCSVARWDIFAAWTPDETPVACFYKARVVESLSPVKEKGKKERERGNMGWGGRGEDDFRTGVVWGGGVQRDLGSCVICLLSFDPRVDSPSLRLSRPSCSFVSLAGNRGASVYKAPGSRFTPFHFLYRSIE